MISTVLYRIESDQSACRDFSRPTLADIGASLLCHGERPGRPSKLLERPMGACCVEEKNRGFGLKIRNLRKSYGRWASERRPRRRFQMLSISFRFRARRVSRVFAFTRIARVISFKAFFHFVSRTRKRKRRLLQFVSCRCEF